jgi:hypothetical protein
MRVFGNEIGWADVSVGEITATATRDQDFASYFRAVIKYGNSAPVFSRVHGAHKSGGACSNDYNVVHNCAFSLTRTFCPKNRVTLRAK